LETFREVAGYSGVAACGLGTPVASNIELSPVHKYWTWIQLGQPTIYKIGRVFAGIEILGGLLIVHRKRCPRNRISPTL